MKHTRTISVLLVTLILAGIGVYAYTSRTPTNTAFEPITTGRAGVNDAELTLQPRLENGQLHVAYRANTHGIGLHDHDMRTIRLEDDRGVSYPISAEPMSGHHAGGTIVFERPHDSFTIVVEGLGAQPVRRYEWVI